MTRRAQPRVVLVGGPETLLGAERGLRDHGVRVDRVPVLRYVPIPSHRLQRQLDRFGPYDLLLLTSPAAVRAMARARALPPVRSPHRTPSVLAGGPATARAARVAGLSVRWRTAEGVGRAVIRPLRSGGPRRIVYPRSNRAGPELAARLRGQGHTVLDLVAYRVLPVSRLNREAQLHLLGADRLVATSPSALSSLRRAIAPRTFRQLRDRRNLVVLGERSARAARGHGFAGVRTLANVRDEAVVRALRRGFERDR